MDSGVLGELRVEEQLRLRGWFVARLDGVRMAPNADVIAIDGLNRVAIQVKTTEGRKGSNKDSVMLGRCKGYLETGSSFFNSKLSPLTADIVVAVNYRENDTRFFVLPVALAENLARKVATTWVAIEKKNGEIRSALFPATVWLKETHGKLKEHDARLSSELLKFENNWDIMREPVERLRDPAEWQI